MMFFIFKKFKRLFALSVRFLTSVSNLWYSNESMQNFADLLIDAIKAKGNPCIIGLDPRLELIPKAFFADSEDRTKNEIVEDSIFEWACCIIDEIKDLVPAVKLQSAFYEQYGVPGMWAFGRIIRYAKEAGLIVCIDSKRNDIGSTAEAYANSALGRTKILESDDRIFDADCMTVSPYLGRDSLLPFVEACRKYSKGIFILVKTSNPGSGDFQDVKDTDGVAMYERVAKMVDELGADLVGTHGYSSIGAVVGATYPEEAAKLRVLMPKAFFLVPGYGIQGGTAADAKPCFNADDLGAIIHSARGITFANDNQNATREEYADTIRDNVEKMIADVTGVLK